MRLCTHWRDICLLKSRIWLFPTSTDAALPVKNELIQVEKGGVWMKEAVFGSSVSVVLNSEWLNGSQKKKKGFTSLYLWGSFSSGPLV